MLRDRCIYEASLIWYMLVTNLIWNRCCVCLGEFELKEELVQIPYCKHVFHLECIHHWLQSNSTCPLCRCSIIPTTKLRRCYNFKDQNGGFLFQLYGDCCYIISDDQMWFLSDFKFLFFSLKPFLSLTSQLTPPSFFQEGAAN